MAEQRGSGSSGRGVGLWLLLVAAVVVAAGGGWLLGRGAAGEQGSDGLGGGTNLLSERAAAQATGIVPLVARPTFTPQPTLSPAPPDGAASVGLTAPAPITGTVAPPEGYASFRVQVDRLDLLQGPGPTYPTVGSVSRDATLLVAGRTADGLWWLVCCVAEQSGWIPLENGNVLLEGDIGSVDIVDAPPAP